jgi:hypothetical protein
MTYKTTIQRLATISTIASAGLLLITIGANSDVSLISVQLLIILLPLTLLFRFLSRIARDGIRKTTTSMATAAGRSASAAGSGVLLALENMPEDGDEEPDADPPTLEIALSWNGEYEIVGPGGLFDYEVMKRHKLMP